MVYKGKSLINSDGFELKSIVSQVSILQINLRLWCFEQVTSPHELNFFNVNQKKVNFICTVNIN